MKNIEPSLLSIDKSKALNQLQQIKDMQLNYVHYDVMDGQFVPPTSFTTEYLKEMEIIGLLPNVHLMVQNPNEWIEKYKKYKINSITFHVESQPISECKKLLDKIHDCGFLAGIAVKPKTDLNKYKDLFPYCDIILIMSVEPGWGGQGFLPECLTNLAIANKAKLINNKINIQIDGGINFDYIKKLYNQVDWFVTGSWFFKNIDHMDQYLLQFKNLK